MQLSPAGVQCVIKLVSGVYPGRSAEANEEAARDVVAFVNQRVTRDWPRLAGVSIVAAGRQDNPVRHACLRTIEIILRLRVDYTRWTVHRHELHPLVPPDMIHDVALIRRALEGRSPESDTPQMAIDRRCVAALDKLDEVRAELRAAVKRHEEFAMQPPRLALAEAVRAHDTIRTARKQLEASEQAAAAYLDKLLTERFLEPIAPHEESGCSNQSQY